MPRIFVTPIPYAEGYRTHLAITVRTEFSVYLNNLPTFQSITVRENFTAQIEAVYSLHHFSLSSCLGENTR